MKIEYTIASTETHIAQILDLQQRNLPQHLTEKQQLEQGFVFAKHSAGILRKMISLEPQFIAVSDNKVIGYNLSMTVDIQAFIPEIVAVFGQFDHVQYEGKAITDYKFIAGGQVCVDHDYRGHGVANTLYGNMKTALSGKYEICATTISERNQVSLKAHQKRGFTIAGTYHDGQEPWLIVVWKF